MATERVIVHERIIQDPAVMAGKPVVRGTRIPVERVLAHLAHTPDLEGLFATYPELTLEDVQASLEVARAAVVDRFMRNGGAAVTGTAPSHA